MQFQAIESLFPTAVGFYRDSDGITDAELEFLSNLEQRPNMSNRTSSDSYLFKQKKLKRIHQVCLEATRDYFSKVYSPSTDTNIYITQAWANYTERTESHHKHSHPNSIISGVYYVNAVQDKDRIKFFRNTSNRVFEILTENFNTFNSESWWLPVSTGTIVLFPSTLEHMVDPIDGDHTRISLAFNTFFTGVLGSDLNLTQLKL